MYLSNTALVLFFHANRILGNKSDPRCAIFLSTCLVSLNKEVIYQIRGKNKIAAHCFKNSTESETAVNDLLSFNDCS